MSNTPTPPTPDMQAAIEAAVNERMAALSGRMDRFEREAFSRAVKDGHVDKRIFGQGDSLRAHAGDGLAHTYRDQWLDRDILDLERLPEQAAAAVEAFVADAASIFWNGSTDILVAGDIPFDTVLAPDSDATVITSDIVNHCLSIVEAGMYLVSMVAHVRARRYPGDSIAPTNSNYASSAAASLKGLNSQGFVKTGRVVSASLRDQLVFSHTHLFDPSGDGYETDHMFLAGPISLTLPMRMEAGEKIAGSFSGILEHSGAGAGITYLSAVRLSK